MGLTAFRDMFVRSSVGDTHWSNGRGRIRQRQKDSGAEIRRSLRPNLFSGHSWRELDQPETALAIRPLEDGEIRDQHVDAIRTSQRQIAAWFELGRTVLRVVLHD